MTRYVTIRGTTMTCGYEDDRGATRLFVTTQGGTVYSYDPVNNRCEDYEPPLCLDSDGLIVRRGARPGYGFLPDAGELERLAGQGVVIECASGRDGRAE